MDGARIFNAACYLNRPVHDSQRQADTVMFCLSKGLGAPVGSMLVGSAEAIDRGASTANVWVAACAKRACWPRPD